MLHYFVIYSDFTEPTIFCLVVKLHGKGQHSAPAAYALRSRLVYIWLYLLGLVRQEESVGCPDNLLHLNNTSKVLDHLEEDEKEQEVLKIPGEVEDKKVKWGGHLVLDHEDKNEDGLHHQLPELRLRNRVEECLQCTVKLDSSYEVVEF